MSAEIINLAVYRALHQPKVLAEKSVPSKAPGRGAKKAAASLTGAMLTPKGPR